MRIATPVNLIVINQKKQILLVKRTEKEDQFEGYWSIPGGGPKEEETYEEALRREIKEEIDCEIESATFFQSYYFKVNPELNVRAIYFYGRIKGNIKLNEEFSDFKWVNANEIESRQLKIAFNQRKVLLDFIKGMIEK
jgi:8-oxo-dGTP diphosphatase